MRAARTISCRVWNLSSSSEAMVAVVSGSGQACWWLGGRPKRSAVWPSASNSMSTAGSRPTTHASWPGSSTTAHGPAGEESHVGVHAEPRLHDRLHVGGPAEAGRVADALHPPVGRFHDVDGDAADLTMDRATDRRQERIARAPRGRGTSLRRGALGTGRLPRALALHLAVSWARPGTSRH